jgi:hypothetical protein
MSHCRGFKNDPAVLVLHAYEIHKLCTPTDTKRAKQHGGGGACLSETTQPCLRAALNLTGLQNTFLNIPTSITTGVICLMCDHGGITEAQVQ